MRIVIKNQSELPIYAQIEEQLKEQILSGEIPEGTVLPSIRKLAKEVGVSVITTARAYSDLEAAGFIATMQGKGSVVLSQDNGLLREQYLKKIEENLQSAITTAKKIDAEKQEILSMLEMLWEDEEA
ncbi:MAG: GntR family transcriptional regulator [Lachnospiraceae bacterium]|nr:GntR family transcriptional regulator [Lachnospiraceae bacterium]